MYTYNGNSVEISRLYNYKGDEMDVGGEPAVGFLTSPEYKTVDGSPYRLVWRDEFDGDDLDKNYWDDVMFVSVVPKRYKAWSDYYLSDSKLHLRIKKDAPDRFSLEDTEVVNNAVAESIVMTGKHNGLHVTSSYHDINPFWGLLTQEGYYECRFKVWKATGGCHTAWWCIGIQDGLDANNSRVEIDVTEILAKNTRQLPHGQHKQTDESATELYRTTDVSVDFATGFHTVGFLWKNGQYKWYVDGTLVDTMNINTPQYPLIHILSAYRVLSGSSWTGDADLTLDDVEFEVDYLRIYKKATSKATEPVSISSYNPITVDATNSDMSIDDDRGCPICFPSYVYVNWSDGSRTEHWVKWQAVQETYEGKMTNHESFQWAGYVYGLGIDIVADVNY